MIACPQCGYDNELGRIFCHSCGTKLDLSKIKPPTEGAKMRRRVKRSLARTIRVGIEVVIVGLIILVIFLICVAPDLQPYKATNDEMAISDAKRTELEALTAGKRGGKIVVSENILNAYINSFTFDKPTGAGLEVTPIALHATVKDGATKLEFLGTIHFGTTFEKNMYLGYEGVPQIINGHFAFKPTGGWFGRLPIHPQILQSTPFFENYVGKLFSKMSEEKGFLEKLSAINVVSNSLELVKDAAPAAH